VGIAGDAPSGVGGWRCCAAACGALASRDEGKGCTWRGDVARPAGGGARAGRGVGLVSRGCDSARVPRAVPFIDGRPRKPASDQNR
jgi:hypothetical protein